MENGKGGQTEGERPDGERPSSESSGTDNATPPSQPQKPRTGFQKAKRIAWRMTIGPIKWLADKLEPYNGLLTALATVALAVLTYFLAIYANELGGISGRQLIVMQGQLDEMRSEQRAWVFASMEVTDSLSFKLPDAELPLKITLHNSGHLPGTNVGIFVHLYPAGQDFPDRSIGSNFPYPPFCEHPPDKWNQGTVFPGQDQVADQGFTVARAMEGGFDTPVPAGSVHFELRGCVIYRTGSDTKFHKTWLQAEILRDKNHWYLDTTKGPSQSISLGGLDLTGKTDD